MNLEALALIRAEQQLVAGAWKSPDPREANGKRLCQVPGCENPVVGRGRQYRCPQCRAAGHITVPCRSCGGRMTRTDAKGPTSDYRNRCRKCRADNLLKAERWAPRKTDKRRKRK